MVFATDLDWECLTDDFWDVLSEAMAGYVITVPWTLANGVRT